MRLIYVFRAELLPHTMTVEITKVLRRRLEGRDSGPMIVTVIPVARSWPSGQEGVIENLLQV